MFARDHSFEFERPALPGKSRCLQVSAHNCVEQYD